MTERSYPLGPAGIADVELQRAIAEMRGAKKAPVPVSSNSDAFRPATWDELVGQHATKDQLDVHIQSALKRGKALDHVLLTGTAGSGKTSLAYCIAERMGEPVECLTMPVTLKALLQVVRSFDGVLILDEIHRAGKLMEDLLPLLEFGYIQSPSGQKYYAEHLTVIGCTTEQQKIIPPLWDRFGIIPDQELYTDDEMADIVIRMARKSDPVVSIEEDDAMMLGRATAGVPRKARKLILSMRDLSEKHGRPATADEALAMCRTDIDGLTVTHMRYLHILDSLGGTAGLKTICSLLELNDSFVTDHERLLLKQGLINRTGQGRELSGLGARKLRASRAA